MEDAIIFSLKIFFAFIVGVVNIAYIAIIVSKVNLSLKEEILIIVKAVVVMLVNFFAGFIAIVMFDSIKTKDYSGFLMLIFIYGVFAIASFELNESMFRKIEKRMRKYYDKR